MRSLGGLIRLHNDAGVSKNLTEEADESINEEEPH